MKTLLLTAMLLAMLGADASAAWCEKRVKCDANGCREILDCR